MLTFSCNRLQAKSLWSNSKEAGTRQNCKKIGEKVGNVQNIQYLCPDNFLVFTLYYLPSPMKNVFLLVSLLAGAATLQAASIDFLADKQAPQGDIEMLTPKAAPMAVTSASHRAHKFLIAPEGTPIDYTIKYNQGSTTYPDRPVQVSFSEDGSSVYFGNLYPSVLTNDMGAWVKGDIQADSTIVVKLQHFMDYDVNGDESTFYELYAGAYDLTAGVMTDAVFVLGEGGVITQQDPAAYIWLGAYQGETYLGVLTYETNIELAPLNTEFEPVSIPETATVTEGIYDFTNAYGNNVVNKGKIATDGNDVYFQGLTPEAPNAWVKGTCEGNTVTIQSGQYLGEGSGYLLKLGFLQARSDFSSYEDVDKITLNYDPETGIYAQTRQSETDDFFMIVEKTISGTIYLYNFNFTIKPYDGPKASIPEDPFNLKFYDLWESSKKYAIMFNNTPYGTDGSYLDPDNRYYYIYLDEEILTFDTETYTTLPEEMTLIPWDFTASNNDIYGSPLQHYAYIYEPLFEKIGVQFVYYFNDKPYCSNIVYIDMDGNVTTVEYENPTTGIANASDAKTIGMEYYNATGQRQHFQQKGLNLVRVTLSDGTRKTYKMYVK